MKLKLIFPIVWTVLCFLTLPISADENHPVIAGYERFLDVDSITDTERGLLLINELGCVNCHAESRDFWASTQRSAPILDQVGQRVLSDYFAEFLINPHQVKPGTTMPNVLLDRGDDERKEIAEAISHFLRQSGSTQHQPTTDAEIKSGKRLFHEVGCVACHNPQQPAASISTSVPLTGLAKKYSVDGLAKFLKNPLHVRASGRMPRLELTDGEVRSIASYLTRAVRIKPEFRYAYYEGKWRNLPDFSKLEVVQQGTCSSFRMTGFPRLNSFGLVFSGFVEITQPGVYEFTTTSDDGSRLFIGGTQVVDNDGIHGNRTRNGKIELDAGFHEVRLEFFEAEGGEGLRATIQPPGGAAVDLATRMKKDKQSKRPAFDESESGGQRKKLFCVCRLCQLSRNENGWKCVSF